MNIRDHTSTTNAVQLNYTDKTGSGADVGFLLI